MNSTTTISQSANAARVKRAQEQADNYTCRTDEFLGQTAVFVRNLTNGKVYTVTAGGCNCPDFLRHGADSKGRATGHRCKHMNLADAHLSNGMDFPAPELVTVDAAPFPARSAFRATEAYRRADRDRTALFG